MHTLIPLFENKDHLIDKLINLTPEQKEEIKAFFSKHPSYESRIDWNDKSLSYSDFESLLKFDGKSKTQAKKKGIEGLVEDVDYQYGGRGYNDKIGDYTLYRPLTYLGSRTLASNKVPPVRESGAQWCIAYQKTDRYWHEYAERGIYFFFILTKDTKYAITLYPDAKIEVYNFEDENLGSPSWLFQGEPSIIDIISLKYDFKKVFKRKLDKLISLGILEANENGTYSKPRRGEIPAGLEELILGGRFVCKFSYWNGDFSIISDSIASLEGCPKVIDGDFSCSYTNLTSLEGGPETVTGNFFCHHNKLTSLKGGPKTVGQGYYCYDNQLTSLEGCPETINENFACSHNKLKTLKSGPKIVNGYFDCSYNELTSLEGSPEFIGNYFTCSRNQLTSLEGGPKTIGRDRVGSYICVRNKLTSLKGSPEIINANFYCGNNLLTSLEGGPREVKGDFQCSDNPLKSLEGRPEFIGGDFECVLNRLTSIEGKPERIGGEFRCFKNPVEVKASSDNSLIS